MRLAKLVVTTALVIAACARMPEPTVVPVPEPTLQQLYLAERYGEVVLMAAAIVQAEPEQRERVAEARFFRALAWLARDPHRNQARALLELRKLEFEFSDVIWGPVAALYVATATRVDALQATLLELGFEQRKLQAHIEVLEQSLVELHAELDKRDTEIDGLERERKQLTEQLEAARAEAATTGARLRELEDELAKLKQIDMQLEP
jgi:septal ring factor EnvC (AmiA/AmiB activator)